MQIEIATVRFKNSLHTYPFFPNGFKLKAGDYVILQTERGSDLGYVVRGNEMVDDSVLTNELHNIVSIASQEVVAKAAKFDEEARKLIPTVKKIIRESGLEMKVVQMEACYDNSRYIINFSAESRVDFRDLVRRLAEALHKRVELRQIGARDEVRMLGGFGPCGKICCCVQNFGEFDHVSMRMAKTQNLSLNPNSISGLCGKLMCCLAYENSTYQKAQRQMPNVGSEVGTKDGKGTVVFNDLVKMQSDVKIAKGDDFEIKRYSLDEMTFKKDSNERKN